MLCRFLASLLAIATVVGLVLAESVISYSGNYGMRGVLYDTLYELMGQSASYSATLDAVVTTLVYTLPETIAVVVMYHIYSAVLGALGFRESELSSSGY